MQSILGQASKDLRTPLLRNFCHQAFYLIYTMKTDENQDS